MEISIKGGGYHGTVVYKTDNVLVEDDMNESIYGVKENGKTDYSIHKGRDVSDEILTKFSSVLEDLAYYRERDFDFSSLIPHLFNRLPQEVCDKLLVELNNSYGE
jgi:hypothetical protein